MPSMDCSAWEANQAKASDGIILGVMRRDQNALLLYVLWAMEVLSGDWERFN